MTPTEQQLAKLRAEVATLTKDLKVAQAREREWRTAYHSLRLTLEDRLDRVTDVLTEWERDS